MQINYRRICTFHFALLVTKEVTGAKARATHGKQVCLDRITTTKGLDFRHSASAGTSAPHLRARSFAPVTQRSLRQHCLTRSPERSHHSVPQWHYPLNPMAMMIASGLSKRTRHSTTKVCSRTLTPSSASSCSTQLTDKIRFAAPPPPQG